MTMNNFLLGKQPRWRWLIGFFLVVFFLVITVNFIKNWRTNRSIDLEITDLQNNINSLKQENLEFHQLINYFNSSAYVEERARVDLGLKKPGEKVIIMSNSDTNTTDTVDTTANRSNAKKWLNYFFR